MIDCTNKAKTHSLCPRHYRNECRYGDPTGYERIQGDDMRRFLDKLDLDGAVAGNHPELGTCWLRKDGKRKYWDFQIGVPQKSIKSYRWAYMELIGPIPEGLELDHFACDNGNIGCSNPWHCRPVSDRENALRGSTLTSDNAAKTHCPQGHPYAGDNLYIIPSTGGRMCKTCQRERLKLYKRAKRAEAKDAGGDAA